MSDTINAYCKICGKGYHMCLVCKDYARMHPWQADTENAEHFKIFQILKGHTTGLYTKAEARERLMQLDLSEKETFIDRVKTHIDEIVGYEPEAVEPQSEYEYREESMNRGRSRRRKREDLNSY